MFNAIADVSRIDDKMTHNPHKSIRHYCLGLGLVKFHVRVRVEGSVSSWDEGCRVRVRVRVRVRIGIRVEARLEIRVRVRSRVRVGVRDRGRNNEVKSRNANTKRQVKV